MQAYLDNSATTKPSIEVKEALLRSFDEEFYNPSSLYNKGFMVEQKIEETRRLIKSKLNADDVIFTSGGTEANNIAIQGLLPYKKGDILYGAGEHPSVLNTCKEMEKRGYNPIAIPYTNDGEICIESLSNLLSSKTVLVCTMQVNNETGVVFELDKISALIKEKAPQAFFHVDGVQAFMKRDIDIKKLGIDSYSLSGHKIHGIKGTGALAVSSRAQIKPLVFGGGQEKNLRPGTENSHGIIALKTAIDNYKKCDVRALKIKLYDLLSKKIPTKVNGLQPTSNLTADNILNLSFEPLMAETLLHALEGFDVYVGNGSACNSRKGAQSHVLTSMGLDKKRIDSAIRFSLSNYTSEEEIIYAAQKCIDSYNMLCRFVRR